MKKIFSHGIPPRLSPRFINKNFNKLDNSWLIFVRFVKIGVLS